MICKCGARTYERHLKARGPAHVFKPDKIRQFLRR